MPTDKPVFASLARGVSARKDFSLPPQRLGTFGGSLTCLPHASGWIGVVASSCARRKNEKPFILEAIRVSCMENPGRIRIFLVTFHPSAIRRYHVTWDRHSDYPQEATHSRISSASRARALRSRITVSVTSGRIPRASTPEASAASTRSSTKPSRKA